MLRKSVISLSTLQTPESDDHDTVFIWLAASARSARPRSGFDDCELTPRERGRTKTYLSKRTPCHSLKTMM